MTENNRKLKQLRKNNKLYEENLRTNQEDYYQAIENCIDGKNNNSNYNTCLGCGWRLADPEPCKGCINGNLYTHINHQNDNEI